MLFHTFKSKQMNTLFSQNMVLQIIEGQIFFRYEHHLPLKNRGKVVEDNCEISMVSLVTEYAFSRHTSTKLHFSFIRVKRMCFYYCCVFFSNEKPDLLNCFSFKFVFDTITRLQNCLVKQDPVDQPVQIFQNLLASY